MTSEYSYLERWHWYEGEDKNKTPRFCLNVVVVFSCLKGAFYFVRFFIANISLNTYLNPLGIKSAFWIS